MNLYACTANSDLLIDIVDTPTGGLPLSYPSDLTLLVAADTRGQAKRDFIHAMTYDHNTEMEWTDPMSIRIWKRDVDMAAGVLNLDSDEHDDLYNEYYSETQNA